MVAGSWSELDRGTERRIASPSGPSPVADKFAAELVRDRDSRQHAAESLAAPRRVDWRSALLRPVDHHGVALFGKSDFHRSRSAETGRRISTAFVANSWRSKARLVTAEPETPASIPENVIRGASGSLKGATKGTTAWSVVGRSTFSPSLRECEVVCSRERGEARASRFRELLRRFCRADAQTHDAAG